MILMKFSLFKNLDCLSYYMQTMLHYSQNRQKVLQSLLHDLEIYCLAYGLKINTTKTKAIIFENSRRHTHYDFYLSNVKLELVTSFKYLGIHFSENGNWHRTQDRLANMHPLLYIIYLQSSAKSNCRLQRNVNCSIH